MNPKKPRPACLYCEKEVKRPYDKYCNNQCQAEYQSKVFTEKWLSGELVYSSPNMSQHIRKYLRKRSDDKCEWCGWSKCHPVTGEVPLEVHHIDGVAINNVETNLVFICPNCHALTSTYRGRNKGNGRKNR